MEQLFRFKSFEDTNITQTSAELYLRILGEIATPFILLGEQVWKF